MISDVLHEAAAEIRRYLDREPMVYPPGDPLTSRIKACAEEMEAIRQVLDSPYQHDVPRR